MADRYSKNYLLECPELAPERHYESANPPTLEKPSRRVGKPDKMLENLDDLEAVYKLSDLLPPGLAKIIREITDVLMKHTQGLIIMRLKRQQQGQVEPPPPTPPSPAPESGPEPGPFPPKEWTDKWHWKIDDPTVDKVNAKTDTESPAPEENKPGVPNKWPLPKGDPDTVSPQGGGTGVYIPSGPPGSPLIEVVPSPTDTPQIDAVVDDVFSSEPEVEIVVGKQDSLVDLARNGYEADDADIKEHYTTEMTSITQRFFQVMNALAEDSNMLDYSDLMQDFDGTAVTTSDPNQQFLIDEICKNQVMYDQSLRQMNLTHTAAKTLVMTRGMTAAEGERERYLGSKYKTNMPTVVAGLSNDLLQKNRESAQKKYENSTYNYYKYLDSATKKTSAMLNMKIDSAIAKAQLANTGSNIFAYTPPPQPQPDDVDDGFDTVKQYSKKGSDYIKEQAKDSKKGSEVDNGTSSVSNSSNVNGKVKGYHGIAPKGTGLDVLAPHPNLPGSGVDRWAPYVVDALVANGLEPTDDRIARVMQQIDTESGGDPEITQTVDDINMRNGTPARGLIQVIPPTFEANAFEGHGNIINGYDNLLAGIHYAINAYGDDLSGMGNGVGY